MDLRVGMGPLGEREGEGGGGGGSKTKNRGLCLYLNEFQNAWTLQ